MKIKVIFLSVCVFCATVIVTSLFHTAFSFSFENLEKTPVQRAVLGFIEEIIRAVLCSYIILHVCLKNQKKYFLSIAPFIISGLYAFAETAPQAFYAKKHLSVDFDIPVFFALVVIIATQYLLHLILTSKSIKYAHNQLYLPLLFVAFSHSIYNVIISFFPYRVTDPNSTLIPLLVKCSCLVLLFVGLINFDKLKAIRASETFDQ